MEILVGFKHAPLIERGATYEIGSGKSHFLSFYFLGENHRLLVNGNVIFADVIKSVDDADDSTLGESEYDSGRTYEYIFSDLIEYNFFKFEEEEESVNFDVDRTKETYIDDIIFKIISSGKGDGRGIVRNEIYRLKDRFDNGVTECQSDALFKDEKSTIENDGGKFIADKDSEDGVFENYILKVSKNSVDLNRLKDTHARKVTDYGVNDNKTMKLKTEIKDVLYDKFQKMLTQTSSDIIINKTMLVDMGNYRELLQNVLIKIASTDNELNRIENKYLSRMDSLLDQVGSGSMLDGNENDLIVDNLWKFYSQDNSDLYINKLDKKLEQDVYSKPILNFNSIELSKHNPSVNKDDYSSSLYKDTTGSDTLDSSFSLVYRDSSDMLLKDNYVPLTKDLQGLNSNKEDIFLFKDDSILNIQNEYLFLESIGKNGHVIENALLKKVENYLSVNHGEKFLFHPLDGAFIVNSDKWFNYGRELHREYSGFLVFSDLKNIDLNKKNIFLGTNDNDYKLFILNHFLVGSYDKIVNISEPVKSLTKFDKGAYGSDNISVYSYSGEIDFINSLFAGKHNKEINVDYGQMLIEKYYHRTVDGFQSICFEIRQRYSDVRIDELWLHKNIREMYKNNSIVMANRDNKNLDTGYNLFVKDTVRDVFKNIKDVFSKVSNKYLNMSAVDLFADVTSKSIKEEYSMLELYKIESSLNSSLDEIQVSRESYSFNVNKDFIWVDKRSIGVGLNEIYSVEASKESRRAFINSYIFANPNSESNRELSVDYDYTMVDKYPRDTNCSDNFVGLSKYARNASHDYEEIFANKDGYYTSTLDTSKSLYRINNKLDVVDTIIGIFKGDRKTDITARDVELSKAGKSTFIDDIEEFVYRDFIKEITFNKDVLIKTGYKEIDNSDYYSVWATKTQRDISKDDSHIGLGNGFRGVFEDNNNNFLNTSGREIFEDDRILRFSKLYVPVFEDKNDIMFDKIECSISYEENKYTGITKSDNSVSANDTYTWALKYPRETYVNEVIGAGGGNPESRRGFFADTQSWISKYEFDTHVDDNSMFASGMYRHIFENDNSMLLSKTMRKTHIDFGYTEASKASRSIYTYDIFDFATKKSNIIGSYDSYEWASNKSRDIGQLDTYVMADKFHRDICKLEQPIFSSKTSKVIGYIENGVFIDKLSNSIIINDAWDLASKTNIDIEINSSIDSISKVRRDINTEYDGVLACKYNKDIYIDTLEEFLNRDFDPEGHTRIEATLYQGGFFIDKYMQQVALPYRDVLLSKGIKQGSFRYEDMWASKNIHHFMIGYENLFIGKAMKHSMIGYENLFIGKAVFHFNDLPVGVGVTKYSKYFDTFNDNLWINKNPKETGINKDFEWIKKGYRDSFFSEDHVWIDKDTKKFNINYEFIWADKYNKEVFVSYSYSLAQKDRKHTNIEYKNIFMDKIEKNGSFRDLIYISKADMHSYLDNSLFIDMDMKNSTIKDAVFINHEDKYSKIDPSLFVSNPIKRGKINKNLFLFEHRAKAKIMEQEFLYLPIHNTHINSTKFAYKPLADGHINEHVNVEEPDMNTFIDSNLFAGDYASNTYTFNHDWIGQEFKSANANETSEFVEQDFKDTFIDYGNNFVFHVSGDEGTKPDVDRSGIIDELILPHKDYKYSDYLKKLILPDGSINMMYVKSFDPDTGEYTVTLPIEHPLNIYTDVGRDYLDVDVAILEMTIHMLKEIWKQKMFRYIAMTAQESLKDMLIDLDKKIKDVYENDRKGKAEARRCLQLFRWYSEMAILNNCEYILKFYGKEVEVNFVDKDFRELENIIELNNMHISDNFMLEPINPNEPASVVFNNNQKNLGAPLNMSFKLYNINRNSSISIIDEKVKDTNYKQGIHEVAIDIKKKAVVGFEPNGEYQSMVITNLKATNYSTNNFSIRYKGVFGETNKVMQDLLDRLLVVGEVSDDLKERLKDVSPVTVALDKLLTYFELHHENKEKGRRLITKK